MGKLKGISISLAYKCGHILNTEWSTLTYEFLSVCAGCVITIVGQPRELFLCLYVICDNEVFASY